MVLNKDEGEDIKEKVRKLEKIKELEKIKKLEKVEELGERIEKLEEEVEYIERFLNRRTRGYFLKGKD
ncbi:MAG TPA: hypothetical protein VK071_07310 [Tissierellales bacterium]|nr:hypothetical protein [Tissierellales bacterium]